MNVAVIIPMLYRDEEPDPQPARTGRLMKGLAVPMVAALAACGGGGSSDLQGSAAQPAQVAASPTDCGGGITCGPKADAIFIGSMESVKPADKAKAAAVFVGTFD